MHSVLSPLAANKGSLRKSEDIYFVWHLFQVKSREIVNGFQMVPEEGDGPTFKSDGHVNRTRLPCSREDLS